jgi:hypothetical protein
MRASIDKRSLPTVKQQFSRANRPFTCLGYSRAHAPPHPLHHARSARCRNPALFIRHVLVAMERPGSAACGGRHHRHGRSATASRRRHDRSRRTRRVRCRAIRRPCPSSAVCVGRIRQPAPQHRFGHRSAGAVVPDALRGPGRSRNVPRNLGRGKFAPQGLVRAARRVEAIDREEHGTALRRIAGAPGARPRRRAMGRRCAGVVAQWRQAVAFKLRSGLRRKCWRPKAG